MKKKAFHLLNTSKNHWYFILNKDFPSGVELPSSTTILEMFPNPNLNYWRETTSPEEIERKQEEGKKSGTKSHHAFFLLAIGEKINPDKGLTKIQIMKLPLETSEDKRKDDELLDYLLQPFNKREFNCLQGFQNFWEEYKPISVGKEMKVYHKDLRYAGTLDWCGYLWNKKLKKYEFWIVDYKISKSHSRAYEPQNLSYYKALCKMHGKNIKARLGILYVGKPTKKKFQLKEIEDRKRAWDDFILTKKLWHSFYPGATPQYNEVFPTIEVDNSFKKKGRSIKFNFK